MQANNIVKRSLKLGNTQLNMKTILITASQVQI